MRGHIKRTNTIKGAKVSGARKGGKGHTSAARQGSVGNASSMGRTFRKAPFGPGNPVKPIGMG